MISRSAGTTDSEEYLAKLADRTFLNLWSYPNLYYDKRATPGGDGKELCDLLVVCGDHLLIFSCKEIQWPETDDGGLAWRRWYKRAVAKSVDQIRGAQRWLEEHPDRVFLDAKCTQRLPIDLPSQERRITHGVVVALGSGKACREFFHGGSGSLVVAPELKGSDHLQGGTMPFCIGDVNPTGTFVHVLDDVSLDIVMTEMDTVSDFTEYLTKKKNAIRSGQIISAAAEEELLAYYATHVNHRGEHDFTRPDGTELPPGESLVLTDGLYSRLQSNSQYLAKKSFDETSYTWDRLIQVFTTNVLAGRDASVDGYAVSSPPEVETALRRMALVPRVLRRRYSRDILEAMRIGHTTDWHARAFLPEIDDEDKTTGFLFLTFRHSEGAVRSDYKEYRKRRLFYLEAYVFGLLRRHPNLRRIVGIATEPASNRDAMPRTEDLLMVESPEWSDELVREVEDDLAALGILQPGAIAETRIQEVEYPTA